MNKKLLELKARVLFKNKQNYLFYLSSTKRTHRFKLQFNDFSVILLVNKKDLK
jgi:hypothetical protein